MKNSHLIWEGRWLFFPAQLDQTVIDLLTEAGMVYGIDYKLYNPDVVRRHKLSENAETYIMFEGSNGSELLAKIVLAGI